MLTFSKVDFLVCLNPPFREGNLDNSLNKCIEYLLYCPPEFLTKPKFEKLAFSTSHHTSGKETRKIYLTSVGTCSILSSQCDHHQQFLSSSGQVLSNVNKETPTISIFFPAMESNCQVWVRQSPQFLAAADTPRLSNSPWAAKPEHLI